MSDLREEIGSTMLRLQAVPAASPIVTGITNLCIALSVRLVAQPNSIMSFMIQQTETSR